MEADVRGMPKLELVYAGPPSPYKDEAYAALVVGQYP